MEQENKSEIKKVMGFFDKLENKVRGLLKRHPVIYTLFGGIVIVLFWRGVWHTADILQEKGGWLGWLFYEPINLIIVLVILLITGLSVSYFAGELALESEIDKEKKVAARTEREVLEEGGEVRELETAVKEMKKQVDEIKELVIEEHEAHHPTK